MTGKRSGAARDPAKARPAIWDADAWFGEAGAKADALTDRERRLA